MELAVLRDYPPGSQDSPTIMSSGYSSNIDNESTFFITTLKGYSYFFSYLNYKTYRTNPRCGKIKSLNLPTICQIVTILENVLIERPLYVFLNPRTTARYWALASIIPDRERFSWNLSFWFSKHFS